MFILGSLKTCGGLPISVNWTFFATCYGWGATSEYRSKIVFRVRSQFDPKFQVQGSSSTNHSSCRKSRINVRSYGIKYGQNILSFCRKSRVWQTDGRIDRRTVFSWLCRACIPCSAVETVNTLYCVTRWWIREGGLTCGLLFSAVFAMPKLSRNAASAAELDDEGWRHQ